MTPEEEFAHDQCDMIVHMGFLERLAAESRVIVEIGAGHGNGSTRAFVRGLVRSPHEPKCMVSVDIDPLRPQLKPTESWWEEVHGDSRSLNTAWLVSGALLSQGWRWADVIFIDTVHTPDYMECELKAWSGIAGEETVWVFHDTFMFGVHNGMNDAIYEYCRNNPWKFVDLTHESHGLGLMIHNSNTREFVWP